MLCHRCGSYNRDDARGCTICSAPLSARRTIARSRESTGSISRRPYDAGAVIGGRYRIVDATARGTAGWVFRASDEEEGGEVAIKVIASNLLQTNSERSHFSKTLKGAKRVRHDNVARILNHGRDRDRSFYVMPYLEGLTLRKIIDLRIAKKQTFAFSEALPLMSQIAQACDAWGRYGYHGALRPSSVMVLPGVLELTGLPHLQGLPRKPFVVFQQRANSLEYLAPECRRENVIIDRRADVYSMAVIFAEMLTGAVYGRDQRSWQRAEASLPMSLVAVLRSALAEEPESRFATGTAFFEALTTAVGATAEPSTPGEPVVVVRGAAAEEPGLTEFIGESGASRFSSRRDRHRPARRRASMAVALVSLVALAGGASWYAQGESDPESVRVSVPRPKPKAPPLTSPQVRAPRSTPSIEPARATKPAPAPIDANRRPKAVVSKWPAPVARESPRRTKPILASLEPKLARPKRPPPAPEPPALARKTACPPDMVRIDGGRFLMGTQPNDPMRGFGDLQVRHRTTGEYCIDRYEFPNRRGSRPTAGVSFGQATRSCESRGKRLCSEIEWERACKGPTNARFPFGNAYREGLCNVENGGRPVAAGAHQACTSGYGVADMSGNVAEWTASRWSSEIPDRVVKGGAADQSMHASRCSARINEVASARGQQLGFRCCAGLD